MLVGSDVMALSDKSLHSVNDKPLLMKGLLSYISTVVFGKLQGASVSPRDEQSTVPPTQVHIVHTPSKQGVGGAVRQLDNDIINEKTLTWWRRNSMCQRGNGGDDEEGGATDHAATKDPTQ